MLKNITSDDITVSFDSKIDDKNTYLYDLIKHTSRLMQAMQLPPPKKYKVKVMCKEIEHNGLFDSDLGEITIADVFHGYINPFVFVHEYVHAELFARGMFDFLNSKVISEGYILGEEGLYPNGVTLNEIFTDLISVVIFETLVDLKIPREWYIGYMPIFHPENQSGIFKETLRDIHDYLSEKRILQEPQEKLMKDILSKKYQDIKMKFLCPICLNSVKWVMGGHRFFCKSCDLDFHICPIVPDNFKEDVSKEKPIGFVSYTLVPGKFFKNRFHKFQPICLFVKDPSFLRTEKGKKKLKEFLKKMGKKELTFEELEEYYGFSEDTEV